MYSTPCAFQVGNSSGIISSNSTGMYNDCSWIITAPFNHNIRLEFNVFQLTDSVVLEQNRILVYDGISTNDTLLGAFTGTRRPFIIESCGRFMTVMLIKQENQSSSFSFKAVYTMVAAKG